MLMILLLLILLIRNYAAVVADLGIDQQSIDERISLVAIVIFVAVLVLVLVVSLLLLLLLLLLINPLLLYC